MPLRRTHSPWTEGQPKAAMLPAKGGGDHNCLRARDMYRRFHPVYRIQDYFKAEMYRRRWRQKKNIYIY